MLCNNNTVTLIYKCVECKGKLTLTQTLALSLVVSLF